MISRSASKVVVSPDSLRQLVLLSRALVKLNADDKSALRSEGFMTRDSREVERKKQGRPKARREIPVHKR